jgi:hypothetical protein
MLKSWKIVALLVGLLVVLILLFKPEAETRDGLKTVSDTRDGPSGKELALKSKSPAATNHSVSDVVGRLLGEMELIRNVHGEAEGQAAIQAMFSWLNELPGETATSAILSVLETGEDAFAFGRFAPGKDGYLQAHGTARCIGAA